MKKNLQFILPIFLFLLIFLGMYLYNNSEAQSSTRSNDHSFKLGVTLDPYPYGEVDENVLDTQISRLKDLGVKWLRFNVLNYPDDPFTLTDTVYNKAVKNDFNVVIIFQPDKDFQTYPDPYQAGYDQAYKITSHYKDVKYFQLGNEPAAAAIKLNWPGIDKNSFDEAKYPKVLSWLKGATEGAKKANPKAKRIITGNWLNVGFFQMLKDDQLNYEIIGWDWHQKTTDLTKVENQGESYNLIEMLTKFNKELWITEAGLLDGSLNGEDKQADFMIDLARQAYQSKKISGFFIFGLYDGKTRYEGDNNSLGILKNSTNSNGQLVPGEPKKAYWVLKSYLNYLESVK